MRDISALATQTKPPDATRRRKDMDAIYRELRTYAQEHGGRYVVYGSAAQDGVLYDGAVDLLIDFPEEWRAQAWRFAESLCDRKGIPHNIMPLSWGRPAFLDRIKGSMKSLG
jgi:hypothetical protein